MWLKLDEAVDNVAHMKETLEEMRASLDLAGLEKRILELDNYMQEPGFWDDGSKAQDITMESKRLKDKLERFNSVFTGVEDLEVLLEMIKESDDEDSVREAEMELKRLEEEIEQFRIETLLSGEYDTNNAILTLHAGAGGTDAQDWTDMLLRMYTRWAEKKGYSLETLDYLPGDEAGIKGVTISVKGEYAYGYLKAEKGIHRLVRISPFNANGKRQTSFASVEVLPELTESQDIDIKGDDLKIDTYRAGGAGGQHVNKTESAIRITHLPTGIVVQCQNERSQHSNKEQAMAMLKAKLTELMVRAHKEKIEDLTGDLKEIGWGSQIRSYVFQPYTMVKDHRTGAENGNVGSVMDGDLDLFINEYLIQSSNGTLEL
ncbi:MAG TPA: peptide chain release factor 2 [Clostridium sp.]|nr:peptide chain release factor 2 [Clostridium sp.]